MEYILKIIKIITLFIYSLFPSTTQLNNIKLPEGFKINIYADNLSGPRFMAIDRQGIPLVALRNSGKIVALPDLDNNGIADEKVVKSSGLNRPNSLAFYNDWIYIAESNRIIRYRYHGYKKKLTDKQIIIDKLPNNGHYTKSIIFGNDNKLYLSIGSSCNNCIDKDKRRGTIMQYNPDGTDGKIYATGLRNSVGLTVNPYNKKLWATDNGRDWLGDNLPHEEINIIKEGRHYGWPFCYDNRFPDPDYKDETICTKTEKPAFKMQAHSAPLGLTFYNSEQFPPEYRGDLFVAFHGSWNRSIPTGYKVVRIKIRNNIPVSIEDFASGWLTGNRKSGRPVDIIVNKQGALLVSDDYGGRIYRIYYDPDNCIFC